MILFLICDISSPPECDWSLYCDHGIRLWRWDNVRYFNKELVLTELCFDEDRIDGVNKKSSVREKMSQEMNEPL